MSFKNIDVNKLKTSTESSENNINSTGITNCLDKVSNYSNWEANAKNVLETGLSNLESLYNELNSLYAKLFIVIKMLEQYKKLELEIKENQERIEILNDSLYYEEEYTVITTNESGEEIEETKTRTVKNEIIEKRINELKRKINEDMIKLEKLEISIKTQVQ